MIANPNNLYIYYILYYIDEFAYLIRYSKFCTTIVYIILMNMPIKYGTLNVVLPLFDIRTRGKTSIEFNKNYISNAIPPTLTCI